MLSPFISLDGLDGTGKSTQCRMLVDWLNASGIPTVHCIDPGGTPLGQELRSILLHHREEVSMRAEALLFMASRAELVAKVIQPALQEGKVVLSDRYLLATVVYQGHAGGLDPSELWQVGMMAAEGLEPDITYVLDLPVEEAIHRRGRSADRMESRDLSYHRRVRDGFLLEAHRRPERFRIIDATPSIDELQTVLRQEIEEFLRNRRMARG
jgi:dTMP kinase